MVSFSNIAMLTKVIPRVRSCLCSGSNFSTTISESTTNASVLESKQWLFPPKYQKPRQAWLENMDTIDVKKVGLLDLHPAVFAANPRIDIIHENVRWQKMYRFVSWAHTKKRFEVQGGGKKPWPQKG